MTVALGVLRWTPETFWNSTFYEFSCAYVGYCMAEGIGPYRSQPGFDSAVEVDRFLEEIEQMKALYPDRRMSKDELKRYKAGKRGESVH